MKILLELFSDSVVSALGWTLVHSIWQGTLLALMAAVSFYFMDKKPAAYRYNLGLVILSTQFLASVATFWYNLIRLTGPESILAVQPGGPFSAGKPLQEMDYNVALGTKVQLWLQAHIQELVICWLIGSSVLLLRFAGGWLYAELLRSKATMITDKNWRTRFAVLSAKLNIAKNIEFCETSRILTPMVIGAFRPVVLLPIGLLTGFPVAQVEAILAHELAHIRRNDYLINLLQSVTEVIYFFHPAIWWLSEKIRTEREHCCDEVALEICEDKMTLAHALVKVAEWQSTPTMAMAFASRRPLLLQRVRRVLGLAPKPSKPFSTLPAAFVAMSLVAGVSMYAIGQNEKKTEAKSAKAKLNTVKTDKVLTAVEASSDTVIMGTREKPMDSIVVKVDYSDPALSKTKTDFKASSTSGTEEFAGNYGKIDMDSQGNVTRVTVVNNYSPDDYQKVMGRILALQAELDKLRFEGEKAAREREKNIFDGERAYRELEKIEWARQKVALTRSDLTMKRAGLLRQDEKKGQQKLADTEIEKLLAEYEEKIKDQEQKIVDYNQRLVQARLETFKAEEPLRETEKRITILENKMVELNKELEIESGKLQKLGPPPAPQMRLGLKMAPPQPPAEPRPAGKVKKAVPPLAPPAPPVPPKK